MRVPSGLAEPQPGPMAEAKGSRHAEQTSLPPVTSPSQSGAVPNGDGAARIATLSAVRAHTAPSPAKEDVPDAP